METVKPNELPEVFCKNLKAARMRAGLSQRALAGLIGSSPNSVVEWENGKASPSLTTVVRLAEALKLSPEMLLTNFGSEMLQPISA
ncbi:helix-turn-helix domain-containing protein [Planctopirus hydrillae]|uniref:HTH cro/C1-type domain-containing protein n=1 Tax=Planctopirus hydrillae TaxID=1841610 RepID=A0A1C3E489_9PLAN|nr:hypothetical protein A6X21_14395 [Planctopirus hydrillae]